MRGKEDGLRYIEVLDLASEFRLCVDVGLLHGVVLLAVNGYMVSVARGPLYITTTASPLHE